MRFALWTNQRYEKYLDFWTNQKTQSWCEGRNVCEGEAVLIVNCGQQDGLAYTSALASKLLAKHR